MWYFKHISKYNTKCHSLIDRGIPSVSWISLESASLKPKARHQFGSPPAEQGQLHGSPGWHPRWHPGWHWGGWGDRAWQLLVAIARNQKELQKRKKENNSNPFETYTMFWIHFRFSLSSSNSSHSLSSSFGMWKLFGFFLKCFTSYTILTSHYSPIPSPGDSWKQLDLFLLPGLGCSEDE